MPNEDETGPRKVHVKGEPMSMKHETNIYMYIYVNVDTHGSFRTIRDISTHTHARAWAHAASEFS